MVCGVNPRVATDNTAWTAIKKYLPVDAAKVGDFQQWLQLEPQKTLFGFSGATVTQDHEIRPTQQTLRAPVRSPGSFQLHQQLSMVLTANITDHGIESERLEISFTSMSGRDCLQLYAEKSDTIADFCHAVATQPCFAGINIRIVLTDGRALDNLNGMHTLSTLLHSCVP